MPPLEISTLLSGSREDWTPITKLNPGDKAGSMEIRSSLGKEKIVFECAPDDSHSRLKSTIYISPILPNAEMLDEIPKNTAVIITEKTNQGTERYIRFWHK